MDAVYMNAVRDDGGGGGWPLTVFLTPDGRPFFGRTYLPPRGPQRRRAPGLKTLLKIVDDA